MKTILLLCVMCVAGRADYLLVADRNSNTVDRFDASTGQFIDTFVAAGSGGLLHPQLMVIGPDGNLYVGSASDPSFNFDTSILEYSGTTGAFLGTFIAAASGGIGVIEGFTFGPNGHAYVGDAAVYEFSSTGSPVRQMTTAGDLPIFGPDGSFYTGNNSGFNVQKWDPSNGIFQGTFVAAGHGLNTEDELVFGPDGNLYISSKNNLVLEYNGTTGAFLSTFVSPGNGLNTPVGIAFGPNGDLFVASSGSNKILEYKGTTGAFVKTFAGSNLNSPEAIVFQTATTVPEPSSNLLLASLIVSLGIGRATVAGRRG